MVKILTALLLLLNACSAMPLTEGPRARLMPGIEAPRDRARMEIRETATVPPFIALKCAQLYARHGHVGYALAAALPTAWITQFGCAFTPWGALVPAEGPIWCDVVYLAGSDTLREHEIRHCEGWDHPA